MQNPFRYSLTDGSTKWAVSGQWCILLSVDSWRLTGEDVGSFDSLSYWSGRKSAVTFTMRYVVGVVLYVESLATSRFIVKTCWKSTPKFLPFRPRVTGKSEMTLYQLSSFRTWLSWKINTMKIRWEFCENPSEWKIGRRLSHSATPYSTQSCLSSGVSDLRDHLTQESRLCIVSHTAEDWRGSIREGLARISF